MSYQVEHRLGRGGMGVVDLATASDGRQVALKRLALHGSAHEMAHARQRIRREAEALGQLHDPGIVELIEVLDETDEIVLVMPYLSGGTLADHVRARGPLDPAQITLLTDTLASALAQAHRLGIVHRDIKPANVLFDQDGNAHLADFGIASFRDATSGLTLTGAVIGTPDYMAPEQARGEQATAASDVFSLGATLLFAATGHPPYGSTDPRVTLHRAAKGRLAAPPATLDKGLRRVLLPLVRRDATKRPTAAEVAGGPAGTMVALAPPTSALRRRLRAIGTSEQRSRPQARRWIAAGAVVTVAMATLATIAFANRGDDPSGEAAPEATSTSTTACVSLPYQPCGQPAPAPNTDGTACLDGFDDYDGDAATGCEAIPDDVNGRELVSVITANLVPRTNIDRYPTSIYDGLQLFCDGTFELTLRAPPGTSMRVELLDGDESGIPVGAATSRDGEEATLEVSDPDCITDEGGDYTVRVSWVGEARSAEPYTLTRNGGF